MQFLFSFFRFTWRIQNKLLDLRSKFDKIRPYGGQIILWFDIVIVISLIILPLVASINGTAIIALLLLISQLTLSLMLFKNNMLTSIRYFFSGIGYLYLNIVILWCSIISNKLEQPVQSFSIIAFVAILLLIWLFISTIANVKVSITVNCIIAGILAIIMVILETLVLFLPQDFALPNMSSKYIAKVVTEGYSVVQLLQIVIKLAFLPLIITSGLGVILAQIKSYWIEKYNDGNDFEKAE